MPAPTASEIAAELGAMRREQAVYRENIEPLAARIGLSPDATSKTIADCEHRLRVLTYAQRHFERPAMTTKP